MTSKLSHLPREILRPVTWLNDSGETVPRFGMVEVESYSEADREYTIVKPRLNFEVPAISGPLYFCNGEEEVGPYLRGASDGFDDGPQHVLVDMESSSKPVGTTVGPVAGSWYVGVIGTGFQLSHPPDPANGLNPDVGSIIRDTVLRHQGVMVEDLAAATHVCEPAEACMRVLKLDTATDCLVETSTVILIRNRYMFIEIAAGTLVRAEYIDAEWSLYGADCGPTGLPIDTAGCP